MTLEKTGLRRPTRLKNIDTGEKELSTVEKDEKKIGAGGGGAEGASQAPPVERRPPDRRGDAFPITLHTNMNKRERPDSARYASPRDKETKKNFKKKKKEKKNLAGYKRRLALA